MKKLWNSKLSMIIFALIFIIACSKKEESSVDNPFSNVFAYVSGDNPLIEMQYEVEHIHFQRVIKNNAQPEHRFFDQLAEKPEVSRQKVSLKVSENGAYYLETIEMDPENPTAPATHNTLPNPTPKVKKTILKGTKMELYSEEGKLLHTSTIQSLDMSDFVNTVKSMKSKLDAQSIADAISAMQVNKLFGLNISEIEEKTKANGGSVLAEGDFKFIKMP
jgi:hypothetical protein